MEAFKGDKEGIECDATLKPVQLQEHGRDVVAF